MIATDAYIGAQVLTFAIPFGVFIAVLLIGFFTRHRDT